MKDNVGKSDMLVRLIIGVVSLVLGYYYSAWWYLLAAIALITAFTRTCLLYALFGLNTCRTPKIKRKKAVKKKANKKKAVKKKVVKKKKAVKKKKR